MSPPLRVFSSVAFLFLLLCGNDAFAQSASFTMSASSGCSSGFTVNFSGSPSGASSYYWNLGNGSTSTSQNPSTTYSSTAGWRYITLTVTNSSGTTTVTDSVYVYNGAGLTFSASSTASCAPLTTTFNATAMPNAPGAIAYDWDFGDGTTASGTSGATGVIPSSTHTYPLAGTYTVTLHATNSAGCDSSFTRTAYITVYPNPNVSFSAASSLYCMVPATATFINNTTGGTAPYTLFWNYGDGNTGSSLTHTYTSSGSFNVMLTVTDANGCQGILTNARLITTVGAQPTFNAPTTACVGTLLTLRNSTSGTATASWNFGDGTTDTGSNTMHTYLAAGTDTIAMTTTMNGCTKTTKQAIVINPNPVVRITQSPSVPCQAPATVTFSASSALATSYLWDFGGGQTATTQTASHTYTANGIDTVTFTATAATGCATIVRIDTVYIRDILVGFPTGPGNYIGCVNDSIYFAPAELSSHVPYPQPVPGTGPYPLGIATWQWDFGDGNPFETAELTHHLYKNVGTYRVRVIISTAVNGCIDSGFFNVHVDSPVHPAFIATPTVVCPHSPVTFINTTPYHANTVYGWNVADTIIRGVDTGRIVRSYNHAGTYSIILFSNHLGCADSFLRINYITVSPPTAIFVDSIFCVPRNRVKFINSSVGATSQIWDFGDGTTDTSVSPVHSYTSYTSASTYQVKLKTFNAATGCTDTMVRTVKIIPTTASFTISDSTLCPGRSGVANGSWTGIGTPHYSFIFGNYQTPIDTFSRVNYYTFYQRGRYDVSFVIASGPNESCHDTVYKHNLVTVSQPIVRYIATPQIGCMPFTPTFTDSSSNIPGVPNVSRLWHWDYLQAPSDSTRTSLGTISHTYPLRGDYDVQLIVTDSLGCTDSSRLGYIYVRKPIAGFSVAKDTGCAYEIFRFSDSSSSAGDSSVPLAQHYWAFGDGATSTADSPLHSYAAPGTYFVRLIVTDSTGCTDTASRSKPIVIRAPHAAFTPGKRLGICPPLLISFTNNSTGAATYLWDFNNGSPLTPVFSPSTTYRNPGVYVPVLIATDPFGCSDTARDTIRVLGYNGAFTYSPLLGCIPLPVSFYAPFGTGVPSLTWDFADGTTLNLSASTTASHTYTTPGAYIPRVIFSDGTSACTSTSVGLDTIKVDKLVAHLTWDPVCVFSPFKLYDSSYAVFNPVPVSAVRWGFGPGDSATGTPVTHTYNTPGNHPVTIIVSNASGCTATETRDVFVNYLPIVSAGPDSTGVCPDDSAKLVATGALTYVWSPAADLSPCRAAACDTAYGHRVPGWYYVMGTDGNGCVNKDSIKAFIQIKTMSSVGAGGEICVGDTFRLSDSGATSYTWSPAQFLDSPNIASPLSKPPTTITFIVAAQKSTCLVDSQRVTVVVHPLPFFDAGPDEELRLGSAVILEATGSGFRSIAWTRDSTLSCLDCLRPTAFPHYTTIYRATFTDIYGCESTDSVTVRVHCNGSLTFIPNTFTPNGDGQNDVFYPRAQGIRRIITFRIFNRWGQMVFERMNVVPNDASMGWDGTFNGQALPPDTYFYMMDTHCETGEPVSWKGDITLVR